MPQDAYNRAQAKINRRKQIAENRAYAIRNEIYSKAPELRKYDEKSSIICRKIAESSAMGQLEAIKQYKTELETLSKEKNNFLAEIGLSEELLEPQYQCTKCGDTGFIHGKRCSCFTQLIQEELKSQVPNGIRIANASFEKFDLSYYDNNSENGRSHRETMRIIKTKAENYANNFSLDSDNLLFTGKTGLGKTFLSIAIANRVMDKGYQVEYHSTQELMDCFERIRFVKSTTSVEDEETTKRILNCDLLILDDLGSEFINTFTQAVLYQVINDRMISHRPTLINTNLDLMNLSKAYHERIVSRLIGSYVTFGFVGQDIRQQQIIRKSNGGQS